MKMTVLLFAILFSVSAFAQDAPTIEQCRADAAMWEPKPYNESFFDAQSMSDLEHRHTLLLACVIAGTARRSHNKVTFNEALETDQWNQLQSLYEGHEMGRLLNFIRRHGEWGQFNKEDAAGQR